MKKRGRRTTETSKKAHIPGGPLLGQYVAKIVVANQRREWEPHAQRLLDQRTLLKHSKGCLASLRGCMTCGRIGPKAGFISCGGCHSAYGCASCWPDQVCATCSVKCSFAVCARRVQTAGLSEGAQKRCAGCKDAICPVHCSYCSGCGKPLCYYDDAEAAEEECRAKHNCPMVKERAKKQKQ